MWHLLALKLVILGNKSSLAVAGNGAVVFECHEQQTGYSGCMVLFPMAKRVLCPIDPHSFALSATGRAFEFALCYFAYQRLAKVDW